MKKLVVGLIALAILAGVGLLVAGQLGDNAFRLAESERDACYASQGYFLGTGQTIPDGVRNQCTQSILDYENGVAMRLVYGALAGLVAAGLFLLIAWFLMFRRREPQGAPPPAV
ncbi:MAG TPA: hypothetical protein VMG08_02315 [Allosphingosinicella sp.]|nr:hypothetical protein [Allosphingosinicella sp.]